MTEKNYPTITVNGQVLHPSQTITYKDGVPVSTVNHSDAINLENYILQAFEIQETIRRGQEELAKLKLKIADEMKLSVMNETTVPLDDAYDIKAKLTERTTKKTDKEEMAKDLGVAVSAINTKFLLKAVEDKKLSFQRYLDYIFSETNEGVSIRRTKATGGKGGKN
jgi:hypothetical protein